jgi:hypothetical protein
LEERARVRKLAPEIALVREPSTACQFRSAGTCRARVAVRRLALHYPARPLRDAKALALISPPGRQSGQELAMRIIRTALAITFVTAAIAGCTHRATSAPPLAAHDFIAADELAHSTDLTLYDAIRRLRPNFHTPRGVAAYGAPETTVLTLYVDGQRMDSIDDLRRISCDEVAEVRFYEPQVANAKFAGHNNAGGAIAVTLKALPPDSTGTDTTKSAPPPAR